MPRHCVRAGPPLAFHGGSRQQNAMATARHRSGGLARTQCLSISKRSPGQPVASLRPIRVRERLARFAASDRLTMTTADLQQQDLFGKQGELAATTAMPEGWLYQDDFITAAEEAELLE